MDALRPVEILAAGMVTPVGLTAAATAAAVRAGISRVRLSDLLNRRFQPLPTGFLSLEYLPPLAEPLKGWASRVPMRQQRLLRLATAALQEAAQGSPGPLPLLLALPEVSFPEGSTDFLTLLQTQSGVPLDLRHSRLLSQGRAGGLVALSEALRLLGEHRVPGVLVGGVDTYLDLRLLASLDAEDRLLAEGLSDGFVPGEGAAFLYLARPEPARQRVRKPLARITSVGLGREEGHRSSDKPYLGEGLSQAFQELFLRWPGSRERIRCVYAGFNGESFWAKEWGVSSLRHARHFADPLRIEHPIELMGDPGAALGPMMVALAALGLRRGYRQGPCAVWCSSDREERAVVMVEASPD
jgi:3-oxoacyl-[acyl-carrier-protein] synthase-1